MFIDGNALKFIFLLAAIVDGAILIAGGQPFPAAWTAAQVMYKVPGKLVAIIWLFDRIMWRWPGIHPWLIARPDLEGTWKGELVSDYVDPQTGAKIPPKEVFLVVRETLTTIHASLLTDQSSSKLLGGSLNAAADGSFELLGTYRNTPDFAHQATSRTHLGGIALAVRGGVPYLLEGHYWTDRGTSGTLKFRAKTAIKHDDFEQAKRGTYMVYRPGPRQWWELWKPALEEDLPPA